MTDRSTERIAGCVGASSGGCESVERTDSGAASGDGQLSDECEYSTASPTQLFAVGDRVMCGENHRELEVKMGCWARLSMTGKGDWVSG